MNKKNNETTLTHLTKRFVKLLNSNSERVINLNDASQRLSVAKRRIYDITNVLEGIGLLQKTSKNVTKWVDCPRDSPFAASPAASTATPTAMGTPTTTTNSNMTPTTVAANISTNATTNTSTNLTNGGNLTNDDNLDSIDVKSAAQAGINLNGLLDAELLALLKTYQALEGGVNDLKSNIWQQLSADGAYVTYHDIKSSFNDQTVIAVKAPPETRLEVNEHLQISIKSERGQIEVYLYQHSNNANATTTSNTNTTTNNNINQNQVAPQPQQQQQQQLHNIHQTNTSPHLQQSQQQQSHSSSSQPLDATFTNNLINHQQTQPPYTSVSSDEGRGKSTVSTNDGVYYDPTSGVSDTDHYLNDPTLSSALSISEDDDPIIPLVPCQALEEPYYNYLLGDNYTITSLYPEDNLGLD